MQWFLGNRAGKRKRVIHAYDEHELRRSNRDRVTKISDSAPDVRPGRKRKLEQSGSDVKKRKPGRPPGRGPGRPAVLHSPGISSKGPLPAGWSVSLKDSKKEVGKKYKQYKVRFVCVCAQANAMQEGEVLHRTQHKSQHGMEQALTKNCLAQASDITHGNSMAARFNTPTAICTYSYTHCRNHSPAACYSSALQNLIALASLS